MARAKRTDRAEARRRYRAQLATQLEAEDTDEPDAEHRPSPAPTASKASTVARPGIRSAFSQAFRPLDLRGDLRYLPALVRQRSVLVPVVITLLATGVYLIAVAPRATGQQPSIVEIVVVYVFQIFVLPPPVGASFLAGFLAVRASWLAGILSSLVSSVCYVIVALGQTGTGVVTTGSGTALVTNESPAALLVQVIFFSVPPAALFAAMAAWYRRFLQLASPNRQRQASGRQSREAARRSRNPRLARGR